MDGKRSGKDRWLLLAVLALAVIASFALWHLHNSFREEFATLSHVEATDGVFDLTGIDFSTGYARLEGDVEFIPGILTPQEYAQRQDEAQVGAPYDYPAATSRIVVKVRSDAVCAVEGASIDFAHKAYFNGELRHQAGVPAEAAEGFQPGYHKMFVQVKPVDGTIEIIQQGANFVHRATGGHANINIGSPETIGRFIALTDGMETVMASLLLALFFVHLMLYVARRSFKGNLLFALLCLVLAARTAVTGGKVVTAAFPALPWELLFRIEYLAMPAACVLVVLLVRALFPGVVQRWAVRAASVVSGAYALLCLAGGTLAMSWAIIAFEAFYALVALYLCIRFALTVPRLVRARSFTTEQAVSLAGLAFFMYAALHDALYHLDAPLLIDVSLSSLAMLVFAFLQTAAMILGTMREVGEARRRQEESRLEAETLRRVGAAKEEFLHNLSHELQAPVTVVSGFAQLTGRMMDDEPVDRAAVREGMRRIEGEADRMERLVAQLLDAAALESGSFTLRGEPFDAGELLETVARVHFPVMDAAGNAVVVQVTPGLPPVDGDRERILQVLLNLVSNAVRHTRGGTVTLAARAADEPGKVELAVADTGEGIAPELLPDLFERYPAHRSAGGNGLGLYIAAQIVEAHGGSIAAESEQGAGTAVRITLPAHEGKASA